MRLQTARALLRKIVEQASTDPMYLARIKQNPIHVLVEEGLPFDIIEDFLQETDIQAEVSGYLMTECANTCALTGSAVYPAVFRDPRHSD